MTIPCYLCQLQLLIVFKSFGKAPDKSRLQHSPNFRNGKFRNPLTTRPGEFRQAPNVMKEYLNRKVEKAPVGDYNFGESNKPAAKSEVAVNWLGHAALLIKLCDKLILTDPMLSKRASPLKIIGPKRYTPSPISAAELPPIDLVLISHDHYDHLDRASIAALKHKVGHFVIPLGVKETMLHWGVPENKLTELDWWQDTVVDNIRITAAPTRHFSGRLFDRNNTLWNSYAIRYGDHHHYFAGDSGFFDGFSEIAKHGPFDLSYLPIGAYYEAWADIHMDPDEAVRVWEILGGGKVLPIHWGTFDLGLHPWYEPIQRLVRRGAEKSVPLLTPQPGEWLDPRQHSGDPLWWKAFSEVAGE